MRSGFEKLQALIVNVMKEDLFEGSLFLFLGKNRRRAKILLFDGTGVVLVVKRLDRNQFMTTKDFYDTREIDAAALERILDGSNLRVVYAAAAAKSRSQDVA